MNGSSLGVEVQVELLATAVQLYRVEAVGDESTDVAMVALLFSAVVSADAVVAVPALKEGEISQLERNG